MSEIIKCVTNPNCKEIMNCDKKIDCTTAIEQAEGLTRYICGLMPCAYVNDPLAQFDNIVKDIRDRQDNAMAMEFTQVIGVMLRENGVTPKITEYNQNYEKGNAFGCKYGVCIESLDFSEHDKEFEDKIAELKKTIEKDKINDELLSKLCEKLMENGIRTFMQPLADDISPYKNGYKIEIDFTNHDKKFKDQILKLEGKCTTWIDKANKLQDKCQELEEHISELEKKETEPINDSAPSMEWYENRHQSDCIEINRLNTTIDVLIHKVEYLRQFAGLK